MISLPKSISIDVDATGDQEFDRRTGLDLLAATARLWHWLGHHDATGSFRVDGVTGPDEYSAIADNNVYTNLMAQPNLNAAAGADRPPRTAGHADRWLRGDARYPAATRPARAGPAARARTRPPDAAGTVKARSRQREPSCSRRERSPQQLTTRGMWQAAVAASMDGSGRRCRVH
jgi:hypothetical protein